MVLRFPLLTAYWFLAIPNTAFLSAIRLRLRSTMANLIAALWMWLRATLYDLAIVWFTAEWYRRVLEQLPEDAHVLDVGIGTAAALVANVELIRRKRLRIVGVDIDAAYIARAETLIAKAGLADAVQVRSAVLSVAVATTLTHVAAQGGSVVRRRSTCNRSMTTGVARTTLSTLAAASCCCRIRPAASNTSCRS